MGDVVVGQEARHYMNVRKSHSMEGHLVSEDVPSDDDQRLSDHHHMMFRFLLWDWPSSSLCDQFTRIEPCPQFVAFHFLTLQLHIVRMNLKEVEESFAEREHCKILLLDFCFVCFSPHWGSVGPLFVPNAK
jgi:hypothetical protein